MPEESAETVTVTAGTRAAPARKRATPGRAPADRKAKDQQRKAGKKAAAAMKAEATGQGDAGVMTFEYQGKSYSFNGEALDDLEVFELIGDMVTAEPNAQGLYLAPILKAVLGEKVWAQLKADNRDDRGRTPSRVLFEVWDIVDELAGK